MGFYWLMAGKTSLFSGTKKPPEGGLVCEVQQLLGGTADLKILEAHHLFANPVIQQRQACLDGFEF